MNQITLITKKNQYNLSRNKFFSGDSPQQSRQAILAAFPNRAFPPQNVLQKKGGAIHKLYLLLFCALLGLPFARGLVAKDRLSFEPKIQSVTVYPDRALVFRSRVVELPEGRHSLLFRNASPQLENASLRAFAGHPSIIVQGIHSWLERQSHTIDPGIRKLEEELQALERREDTLHLGLERIQTELSGIKDYEAYLKRSIGRDSKAKNKEGAGWQEALVFLAKRKERALESREDQREALRKIKKKISITKKKLSRLQQAGRKYRRIVEIHLQATRPVRSQVGFSYMMRRASWQVSYGMRYQKGRVEVDYFGNIRQLTGEDWKGVKIRLSTSRPATGAARPKLRALSVGARRAKTRTVYTRNEETAGSPSEETASSDSAEGEGTGGYTELDSQGNSVVFRIPGRANIPSSKRRFRLSIARFALKPLSIEERIVGAKQEAAYTTARLRNNRPFPMLAGAVDVYRSSGFIGRSQISHTPSNGSFLLNLGSNRNIQVERLVRRFRKKAGVLSSREVFRRSIRLRIQNRGGGRVRLHVLERIPVSETEDVKIRILSQSTAGYEERPKDSGILHWKLPLSAGEKKSILLEYEVETPQGFPEHLLR